MKFRLILTFIFVFAFSHSKSLMGATTSTITSKPTSSAKTKIPQKNIQNSQTSKKKRPSPPPEATLSPPPEPPQEDIAEILYPDEFAGKVSSAVVTLANRIDSFFGAERSDDEKNGSTLRVVPSYTFYEHKKGVAELGLNLNLKLINLESKAKNLEKAIREEFIESPTENNKKDKAKPSNKESEEDWHYNFESKLASRPALYYSGKLRARRNYTSGFLLNHFSFSAGWDTDDQWSQKTSLFSDNAINDLLLFRFINEVNWFLTKKLFQTTHGPSLIQSIDKYNSVSYNFRLVFENEINRLMHINTSYSINYRHGTPSQRIFIDLIPAYSYPKDESFNEVKSLEIRFEYFFGDLK